MSLATVVGQYLGIKKVDYGNGRSGYQMHVCEKDDRGTEHHFEIGVSDKQIENAQTFKAGEYLTLSCYLSSRGYAKNGETKYFLGLRLASVMQHVAVAVPVAAPAKPSDDLPF